MAVYDVDNIMLMASIYDAKYPFGMFNILIYNSYVSLLYPFTLGCLRYLARANIIMETKIQSSAHETMLFLAHRHE